MKGQLQSIAESVNDMAQSFVARLPYLVVALIVFVSFYFAAKGFRVLARNLVHQRHKHRNAALVFGRLMQASVVLLGLMVALVIALPTFRPAQLVEFLGIGTIAIGFAFRDVLQNFLAGILLLITEPFRIGDQIKFEEFEGVVEDVQTRATMLRTYDGRRIVIPNANLFTNSVTVNTAFEKRRLEFDVGIGYGDDIAHAKRIILHAIGGIESVLNDPPPEVLVVEFGASSVKLRVRWWFQPPKLAEAFYSRDEVFVAIKNAFITNGIDTPFEVRTVLFHDQTDEADGNRARQREGWPAGQRETPKPLSIARALREMASLLRVAPVRATAEDERTKKESFSKP